MANKADDLSTLLQALAIDKKGGTAKDDRLQAGDELQADLEETGFSILTVKQDLGFVGWKPLGRYRSIGTVSVEDIKKSVDASLQPTQLAAMDELNSKLPLSFAKLPSQSVKNKYPHSQWEIASLYVAVKERSLNVDDVDFFFGGSTLHMLVTQRINGDTKYLVALVPGTKIIMVRKHKDYFQNYSDPGFQFERFVTGGSFRDRHDENMIDHIQLFEIGKDYQVLFTAESDAVDEDKNPVEVTASNPRNWGSKVLFQMISNGSRVLTVGRKRYGGLTSVECKSLKEIAREAVHDPNQIKRFEQNILQGLKSLKKSLNNDGLVHGKVYEIRFSGGDLKLQGSSLVIRDVFPRDNVVTQLLA